MITKIYLHREKYSNRELQEKVLNETGIEDIEDNLLYVGYEIELEIEITEDLRVKVLKFDKKDMSDKEIYID